MDVEDGQRLISLEFGFCASVLSWFWIRFCMPFLWFCFFLTDISMASLCFGHVKGTCPAVFFSQEPEVAFLSSRMRDVLPTPQAALPE